MLAQPYAPEVLPAEQFDLLRDRAYHGLFD